ncbi:hypothetical protein NKH77_54470 [Streptomyces sp. M19]
MVTSLAVGYGMSGALNLPAMLAMMVSGMMGLMSAFAVAENTRVGWPAPSCGCRSRTPPRCRWPRGCTGPGAGDHLDGGGAGADVLPRAVRCPGAAHRHDALQRLHGRHAGERAAGRVRQVVRRRAGGRDRRAGHRLALCYPMPREDLLRTQRAFVVEARRVADAAATALDPDADRETAVARMRRSLRRLNVTTVTIDGRLAQPEVAADPHTAELLHQHLFDAELALQGIGQAVQRLTRLQVSPQLREAMVVGLLLARDTPLGRADALRPAARLIQEQATAVLDAQGAQDVPAPSPATAVAADGGAGAAARPLDPDEAEAAALARRVGHLLDSLADSSRAGWTWAGTRRGRGRRCRSSRPSRWSRTSRPGRPRSPSGSRRRRTSRGGGGPSRTCGCRCTRASPPPSSARSPTPSIRSASTGAWSA